MSIFLGRRRSHGVSAALGKNRSNSLLRVPLIWILLCGYPFIAFGCSKHPVLFRKDTPGKKVYQQASPSELSDYIRTVFKISKESAESAKALNELHQQRPTLEELSRHIADNPEDVESRRSLAAHYLREGLYHNAFQLYQEIRGTGLEDAAVERGLARIWSEWGNYSLAKRHAERALALDPESAETLEWLGKIHLRGNEPQAAVSVSLAALSLMPENPSLLSNIGSAFLKLGNWAKGLDYLDRALVLDPTLIEARNNLGKALAHLGDYQGALREFGAGNNPATALNKLGVVYLEERKWTEAENAFRQALVLAPDYRKARLNLSIAQSYLPPATIVNLPPLEVAGSLVQSASVKSEEEDVLQDENKRTEELSIENVQGGLQNLNRPYLNAQLGFSAVSPYLPTPTIVNLPPFEGSGWKPDHPDPIPASKGPVTIPTVTQTVSELYQPLWLNLPWRNRPWLLTGEGPSHPNRTGSNMRDLPMNPEYPPENSFPPGSRAGVGYPLIVGLPGVGLGVVFWFAIVMGITSRSLNSGLICLSLGGRQQARRTDVLSQPSRKQSPEDPFLLPAVRIDHEIAEELRVISKIKDIIRPL